MRVAKSCSFCRSRKKRCAPGATGYPCKECTSRDVKCSLAAEGGQVLRTPHKTTGRAHHPLLPRSESFVEGSSPLGDFTIQDVCEQLVDLYFEVVHEKQHIIFHQPTFVAEQRLGTAPEYLVWGMAAVAARFSDHSIFSHAPRGERGHVWLQKAIHSFNCRDDPISISALQGALLLEFACAVEGNTAQGTLFSAQAIRMAMVMRLPQLSGTDVVQHEVEIRLYWQVWMMDAWQSARGQYHRQIRDARVVPHPLEEKAFNNLRGSSYSGTPYRNGLWSAMLPLSEIHYQVMLLNDTLCASETDLHEVAYRVKELSYELESWHLALPLHLQYTPENTIRHIEDNLGRQFSILHILYHFQSQLLYFQYLQKDSSSCQNPSLATNDSFYADRCKSHAIAMSQIMWSLDSTPGMDCFWSPANGHLLVVASSIHLHSLLFDTDEDCITETRKLLEQNFVLLLQLEKYWPILKHSMMRLRAFHKTCLCNANPETVFAMDRWMIQFLNRYETAICDRYGEGEQDDIDWPSLDYVSGIEKLWTRMNNG
ncbi:hypothetical protein BKA66DRAFT_576554 [Pyrenochaeta sp. MPI-SDFR-AT-0127]|nr:hypothetical protein BKA66DRAFT_576554 [Pyrenochaeta sp. MPI-SDFR-AT-0127]